jgi:hypothetical protein
MWALNCIAYLISVTLLTSVILECKWSSFLCFLLFIATFLLYIGRFLLVVILSFLYTISVYASWATSFHPEAVQGGSLGVLDKLANKLSMWRARLLTREGRAMYVQVVMRASVIYHLMALDLDPWFLQAVDKLWCSFLWATREEAHGGCCVVGWDMVCQPKHLGGLGFHNLHILNAALRMRWISLQKTEMSKTWQGLDL